LKVLCGVSITFLFGHRHMPSIFVRLMFCSMWWWTSIKRSQLRFNCLTSEDNYFTLRRLLLLIVRVLPSHTFHRSQLTHFVICQRFTFDKLLLIVLALNGKKKFFINLFPRFSYLRLVLYKPFMFSFHRKTFSLSTFLS
jgi:hypothetical protein